jgi:pimeloyl-ACP methyl ester carboxylesterase
MKGRVVLSHGLESGPDATKVAALAAVARELGWEEVRPDYLDIDATKDPLRVAERIARLVEHLPPQGIPLVLAGSSMGAFISGLASLRHACRGLFLIAPPMSIEGFAQRFDAAHVPLEIVHGWDDELIPADAVIDFARRRSAVLHVVNDTHRLSGHVDAIAAWFRRFLSALH